MEIIFDQYLEMYGKGESVGFKFWRLNDYNKGEGEWSLMYKMPYIDIWSHKSYYLVGGGIEREIPCCIVDPLDHDVVYFYTRICRLMLNNRTRKMESWGEPGDLGYSAGGFDANARMVQGSARRSTCTCTKTQKTKKIQKEHKKLNRKNIIE